MSVVLLSGELDLFAVPDLESAFAGVRGDSRVLADLGHVSFMDSTALGLIVRFVRELGESGASVRVVLPGGTARRIFEITSLDRALPLADDRRTAIAQLED